MALLGYNGGLRGKPRIPSTSNASGIWDLDEQKIAAPSPTLNCRVACDSHRTRLNPPVLSRKRPPV
jgi:hypothetical protein